MRTTDDRGQFRNGTGLRLFPTALLEYSDAQSDSPIHSTAEIYFADYISQERGGGRNCRLVWRGRGQALRDDAQRHGEDQADSKQSSSTRGPLHDPGNGHGSRDRRDGAYPASGGTYSGACGDQPEVLGGADSVFVVENRYVY